MSVMNLMFSVGVTLENDEAPIVNITCDRCGVDLSRETYAPLTIINFKGNLPRAQFEQFKREWTARIAASTNVHKAMIVNVPEGIERVTNTESFMDRIVEHAKVCAQREKA